ncbi:MAG: TMEM175 family protein [Planctomycetota bacterium]
MSHSDERWERQLRRIETLSDVVFGVMLVRIFMVLPKPRENGEWVPDMLDFFVANVGSFATLLIGFVITIIYWIQSNATLGVLRRSDTRHTITVLIQLVALLLFMHAILMGAAFAGDTFAMVWESFTAGLVGFVGWVNWAYATRDRKLVEESVSDEEIVRRSFRLIPEPVTAALTIPCAFIGPGFWGLSWFVIAPAVAWITKKKLAS